MSNLTNVEKRKFEQLLGMNSGYVLDFTNRSFAEFVSDSTGRNIFDRQYDHGSGSKANRLRAFWQKEDNAVVGKLMGELLDSVRKADRWKRYAGSNCSAASGRRPPVNSSANGVQSSGQPQDQQRSQALRQLKDEFFQLADQATETRRD